MSTRKRDVQQHANISRRRRRAQLRTALGPSWPARLRFAGPPPPHAGSMLLRPPPAVSSLFSFLRCGYPRHLCLANAGRHRQDLPLGERRRPSLPCRSPWHRAGRHTHLFHV